jgi:hypothetical protein
MEKYYHTNTDRILEQDFGIASTRVQSLRQAIRDMHKAVCYLDKQNLKLLWQHCPEIVDVANFYGKNEEDLRTFNWEELRND